MKNTILIAGFFLILGFLLAGCTNSDDSNEQNSGVQQEQLQDPGLQNNGNGQGIGRGMGGPRGDMGVQSIEACSGKAAGDACTLYLRNQSVDGTCTDRNGNVSCKANSAPIMQGPGIPGGRNEESMQACSGKGAGELCTMTMRNQTSDGKCTDRSGTILCVSDNMDQRRGGPENPGL